MQSRIVVNSQEESLLSTHKVLRNTYFLLGLTMAFSAVVAYISMSLNLPYPNLIVLLVGFYGLLFVTNRLANSAWGILAAFAFTGFMGYTIGPILNMYVARGMEDLIMLAFARYSNRLLCLFSLCAYNEERYVFPFYRDFLIIYRVIVRDCGKLLLPNSSTSGGDQCIVCGILNHDNPL